MKRDSMFIDIETYSSQPLPKCGVYRYSQSSDFQILLVTYGFDDEELKTIDLACGEPLPSEFFVTLEDPNVLKYAHLAQFERVCFSRYLGHWLDPHQWRCSMIMANYLTLPGKLADVAVTLNLTERKMEEGKDLIRYFSVPCKPTKANGGRTRNLPGDAPEKWELYKKYNRQDVETERAVVRALEKYPLPQLEWDLYALDQIINDRGVRIDKQLVRSALIVDSEFTWKAYQRAQEITGLENPSSVVQLKAWLADQDMPMETLAKKVVQEKAKDAEGIVGELLRLRLELSKTSVKKYEAMARTVCKDGRIHGVTQFYGASRTGRWAGRLVQLQNVPQNHLPDLDEAKEVVKKGDADLVEILYGSVPNTLSELIRTALIPKDGCRFLVADFSAIEARTLAWLAGEEWVLDEFRGKGKIYEATAARMYHIPVETIVKGNPNYEYRQKGKQATLACIAEGELVLTNHGLKPIETITLEDLVWDGFSWVQHEGLIYKGEGETITYEGLTATPDHLVWIKGQSIPIQFGVAAASGAHLIQTGNGGNPIRLGEDYKPGETVERTMEQVLCPDRVRSMPCNTVDSVKQSAPWIIKRLSELLRALQAHSCLAGKTNMCSKTTLLQQERSAISSIWRPWHQVQLSLCYQGWYLDSSECSECTEGLRIGSDRQQWSLRAGEYPVCPSIGEQEKQGNHRSIRMGSSLLAVLRKCGIQDAYSRDDKGADHRVSQGSCQNEAQELAHHKRKARLYDLRNAGPHHRFTVSNHLVHNCGYGGGVGAMKNMGATMPDEELQDIVEAWRAANPHIVSYWAAMERTARRVADEHITLQCGKTVLYWKDSNMFMRLPSGRDLCYQGICYTKNRFGNSSLGYYMPNGTGKMELTETFGGKLVENLTQAVARDILANSMLALEAAGYHIVFHVHDEVILEVPYGWGRLEDACRIMGIPPAWAPDLPLRADGVELSYYRKM